MLPRWQTRDTLWLAVLAALALALRAWNLDALILAGDEIHGVRAALGESARAIFLTYREADHGVPMTLYLRALVTQGLTLSEPLVRLPSLLAGGAAVVVIPRLVFPHWGRSSAVVAALLVAGSPPLVYYSRIARPYVLLALFSFVAAVAFWQWLQGRRRGWAVAFVLTGGLLPWIHPFGLPWLLLTVGVGIAFHARRPLPGRGLLAVLAGTALVAGALVGPAIPSLLELLPRRQGQAEIPAAVWLDAWRLQSGYRSMAVAAGAAVLAAVGLTASDFGARCVGFYLAAIAALQVAAVWLLAPSGGESPIVLARYAIGSVPVALVLTAAGIVAIGRWLRRALSPVAVAIAGILALALHLASLPYVRMPELWFGPWGTSHQALASPITAPAGLRRSDISTAVGRGPGVTLVEGPWPLRWHLLQAPLEAQLASRGGTVLAYSMPGLNRPDLDFATIAAPFPESFVRSRADWAVIHAPAASPLYEDLPPAFRRRMASVARRLAGRLEKAWGAPDLVRSDGAAWDLDRVRRLAR